MKKFLMVLACVAMVFVSCSKSVDSQIDSLDEAVAKYEKLVEDGVKGEDLTAAEKSIEEIGKFIEEAGDSALTEEQQTRIFGIAMRYAGAKMKSEGIDFSNLGIDENTIDEAVENAQEAVEGAQEALEGITEDEE